MSAVTEEMTANCKLENVFNADDFGLPMSTN